MKEIKAHPILLSVLGVALIHYAGLGFGSIVLLLAILILDVNTEVKSNICQWALFEVVYCIAAGCVGYIDRFWHWFWGFFREDYSEAYDLMTGKLDIFGYIDTFLGLAFFILFVLTLLTVAKNGKIKLPLIGAFVDKFFYPGAEKAAQGQAPQQQLQTPPMNNGSQPPKQ